AAQAIDHGDFSVGKRSAGTHKPCARGMHQYKPSLYAQRQKQYRFSFLLKIQISLTSSQPHHPNETLRTPR
ncbi:MAG: hypothetical protein ACLGIY_17405, partial [Betaproteobacteria bacterium]